MRNTKLIGLLAVHLMVFGLALPTYAADSSTHTTCKDGTTSTATGRGACSGHGGVQKAAKTTASPAASAAATPASPAASGSATTCKDGTTSTATGRGACSGHGGVQKGAKTNPASDAAAPAPATTAAPAAASAPATAAAPHRHAAARTSGAAAAVSTTARHWPTIGVARLHWDELHRLA